MYVYQHHFEYSTPFRLAYAYELMHSCMVDIRMLLRVRICTKLTVVVT